MKNYLQDQRKFSELFYDSNKMKESEKQEMLKTLSLSAHNEISKVVQSTNFKFYNQTSKTDVNKLLYNSIDAFRYILAIWNLYDIDCDKINKAFVEKDVMLNMTNSFCSYEEYQNSKSAKDKAIIIDIDDILCKFRSHFNSWLRNTLDVEVYDDSESYYSSVEVKKKGLSPEKVFEDFIECDELLNIPPIYSMILTINKLYSKGYYIQLLTSRPENNLKCKYQTFVWLKNSGLKFHNLAFSAEKYLWLAKQKYYIENKVLYAVDDSGKHATEYATHGVNCLMPDLSYNKNAINENITRFDIETQTDILLNFDIVKD